MGLNYIKPLLLTGMQFLSIASVPTLVTSNLIQDSLELSTLRESLSFITLLIKQVSEIDLIEKKKTLIKLNAWLEFRRI